MQPSIIELTTNLSAATLSINNVSDALGLNGDGPFSLQVITRFTELQADNETLRAMQNNKLREALDAMLNDLNASIRREQTEREKNAKLLARIEELEKIGENILSQDNRSTSCPIFCVFQKEEIVVDEDFYYDKIIWCTDDGEEASPTRSKRLNILDEHYCDTGKWNKRAIKMVDSFVTACFTEEGCKKYLSINGHNLKQPFIYAVSGYRNSEYQSVRDFLSSIPSKGDK